MYIYESPDRVKYALSHGGFGANQATTRHYSGTTRLAGQRDDLLRYRRPSTNANIPGMVSQVSQEHLRFVYDHLDRLGEIDHLDLFIYTRGGDADVPWPMVNFIREFATKFSALVPYHCHSAGTLICLGADEILMGTGGTLSSVDPTTVTHSILAIR